MFCKKLSPEGGIIISAGVSPADNKYDIMSPERAILDSFYEHRAKYSFYLFKFDFQISNFKFSQPI